MSDDIGSRRAGSPTPVRGRPDEVHEVRRAVDRGRWSLCGPCHLLLAILEARERNAVPDFKMRAAGDAFADGLCLDC